MPSTAATVVRRVREAMLRLVHPVEARISPDGRSVAVAAAGPGQAELVLAAVPAGLRDGAAPPPVLRAASRAGRADGPAQPALAAGLPDPAAHRRERGPVRNRGAPRGP